MHPEKPAYLLDEAEITWRKNAAGQLSPWSPRYKDIYCDPESGAAEKKHVFIDGNRLSERWGQFPAAGADFCILETGFGFGLNFLQTLHLWRSEKRGASRLHYISLEMHPVSKKNLLNFYEQPAFRDAGLDVDCLQQHYPMPASGFHRLHPRNDVSLTLVWGDMESTLPQIMAEVDAWYLDGFKPTSNPSIWSAPLFKEMVRLSRKGASFSTYSVAGVLRRQAQAEGFNVEKRPGFGRKAEMLVGSLGQDWQAAPIHRPSIAILGAGMAGLFLAKQFQHRGISAAVFDGIGPMAKASGMHQFSTAPQLTKHADHYGRFSLNAFLYLRHLLGEIMESSGVIKLADQPKVQERLDHLPQYFSSTASAKEFLSPCQWQAAHRGAIYRDGGWISGERLTHEWTRVVPVKCHDIQALEKYEDQWALKNGEGTVVHRADHVLLATGATGAGGAWFNHLPLHLNKGHSLRIRLSGVNSTFGPVISGPATLFPPVNGLHTLSGGWDHGLDPAEDQADEKRVEWLLGRLAWMMNKDRKDLEVDIVESRVGWRCTSRDRRPLVDCLTAENGFERTGLWLSTAFGSHALTHSPLCAEFLVSRILNEPWPLARSTAALFSSDRFAQRDARRQSR